jgi:hypothetical protein
MKKLQVIYKAQLLGMMLFGGIVIFVKTTGIVRIVPENASRVLQVIAVLFSFVSVWAGMRIYRKRVGAAKEAAGTAENKMAAYTSASILKWATTEAPCLFCIIGILITGNWSFAGLAAILLFIFAGYNPQKDKVMNELALTDEELSSL